MGIDGAGLEAEVTDLIRHLIRNRCVNEGTTESGHERRSADTLAAYLGATGLDLQTYEPVPDRASLVARIEGSDPAAPTLVLMGHTDVVPVTEEHWRRDPFGGELVDGEVWGRGAVDMLNLTSSMATAFRHLATTGFTPRGTLVYLAVADEEALGTHGAQWLLDNEAETVTGDYLVTESGGIRRTTRTGTHITVSTAEKGANWVKLRVEGTPGHASRPLRTDNALVKAAEIVRRLAAYQPRARITEVWRRYVEGIGFDADLTAALLDPDRVLDTCLSLDELYLARFAHACTHTTFAPTILHGGTKINVIPDTVSLEVDIRSLPGDDVPALLHDALGDMADEVTIEALATDESTASPLDTPMWDAMSRVIDQLVPGARALPTLMVGATDARFFRRRGVAAYGAGLFSDRITPEQFGSMFHGNDERVDTESLRLTTELWIGLAQELLA